jgi:tetratricopeptide (TPR) repeat protein
VYRTIIALALICAFACTCQTVSAQVDDVSEVTGLPIPIGAPVIYGQVLIKNFPKDARRPNIVVYLRNGGAQLDKYQTNDKGYWYFLKNPTDGHSLTFEVDGIEVGRAIIASAGSNRFRQDVEFDWNSLKGGSAGPSGAGVVSARDRYGRGAEAEKMFEKALSARNADGERALKLLIEVVQKDDKDFNAWMQIGALHYSAKRMDEAKNAYNKAISLKPDYFLALLNLGKLELSQKNYEAAVPVLLKAVEADANSADANHLLGESYLQIKKGSLAVGYLNKAIELAPIEKAEVHLRLAALYNAAGLKDRASSEYKAFLEKVKDHPDKKKLEQYIKDNPPKT